MSWKFWKPPEEQLKEEWDKAISLRNQGKWKEAAKHFSNAAELSKETVEAGLKKQGLIANALAQLYIAVDSRTSENFLRCYEAVTKLDPETVLEIPYKARAMDITQELKVFSEDVKLPKINLDSLDDYSIDIAEKFEAVAQAYLGLGHETLTLGDLFKISDSAYKIAFRYLGFSKLLKGHLEEKENPGKAVDDYAEAMGNFAQAALNEYVSYLNQRCAKLTRVTKCWFCGRAIQGEDIHYLYLETIMTPYMLENFTKDFPDLVRDNKVAACVTCYGAIHTIADVIARGYYEAAVKALRETEQELLARITALERRLGAVEARM
jgi:tetratricopeptide (TPR) repeat protein